MTVLAGRAVGGGRNQLLGAGEGRRIRCILDVASLEIQAAAVEPQRDDAEQNRGRKGHDDEALRLLTASQLDQHLQYSVTMVDWAVRATPCPAASRTTGTHG